MKAAFASSSDVVFVTDADVETAATGFVAAADASGAGSVLDNRAASADARGDGVGDAAGPDDLGDATATLADPALAAGGRTG